MLRMAICDDDIFIHQHIQELIGKLDMGLVLDRDIILTQSDYYKSGSEFLDSLKDNDYDVVFMDIEIGGECGVDVIEKMRTITHKPRVIFISSHNNYFRDIAEIGSFSFIQKPIELEAFNDVIKKLFNAIDDELEIFIAKSGRKKIKIPINKIMYFEKCERKTLIVAEEFKCELNSTLKKIMEEFDNDNFFSPNNSFAVNYDHIKEFTISELTMTNGQNITISERRRKEIKTQYFSIRKEKCIV